MKRIVCLLLVLTLVLSFAACGSSEEVTEPTETTDSGFLIDIGGIPSISIETIPPVNPTTPDMGSLIPTMEPIVLPTITVARREPIEIDLLPGDHYIKLESVDAQDFANDAADNFAPEDRDDLTTMDQSSLDQLAQTRSELLQDLLNAFEREGIPATVDMVTGEVYLESAVLFGVDEYAVSQEGKELLYKFLYVFTSVLFSERYSGFVNGIVVEGHTDTSGSYEHNLQLSQKRADAVLEYCMSEECALPEVYVERLAGTMTAVGYSYDKPIYAADGSVDMDASRRVSFRFIITIKQQ